LTRLWLKDGFQVLLAKAIQLRQSDGNSNSNSNRRSDRQLNHSPAAKMGQTQTLNQWYEQWHK
jgi:hypothetical protein